MIEDYLDKVIEKAKITMRGIFYRVIDENALHQNRRKALLVDDLNRVEYVDALEKQLLENILIRPYGGFILQNIRGFEKREMINRVAEVVQKALDQRNLEVIPLSYALAGNCTGVPQQLITELEQVLNESPVQNCLPAKYLEKLRAKEREYKHSVSQQERRSHIRSNVDSDEIQVENKHVRELQPALTVVGASITGSIGNTTGITTVIGGSTTESNIDEQINTTTQLPESDTRALNQFIKLLDDLGKIILLPYEKELKTSQNTLKDAINQVSQLSLVTKTQKVIIGGLRSCCLFAPIFWTASLVKWFGFQLPPVIEKILRQPAISGSLVKRQIRPFFLLDEVFANTPEERRVLAAQLRVMMTNSNALFLIFTDTTNAREISNF